MRAPKIILIFLWTCLTITGCDQDPIKTSTEIKPGTGEYYFQQGIKEKDASKMLGIFKQGLAKGKNDNDTISLWLYDGIIHTYNRVKEYDSALAYSDKMVEQARSFDNTRFVALGYYRKASIYRKLHNSKDAFLNYYLSRQNYLSIGDSINAGQRSMEMANTQARMSDYSGSQENATRALRLLSNTKDSAFISNAYNLIAISYRNRDFPKDAIREYENALRFSGSLKDSLSYLNNMALVWREEKNYEKALQTFDYILKNIDLADDDSRARFIDNAAYTKWKHDPEKDVLKELENALEIRLKINELDGIISSYEHLSEYYEKKDPAKALDYALKMLKTAKRNSSANAELNALKRIIALSSAERAQGYTSSFLVLNDSLQQANLKAENTFAKIQFDEEQKEKEINQLENRTALQAIEKEQLQSQIIILSLGGLLFLVSGGFGIYYLREKHRKEKIRETHQTEARISKKIHDELANDVYNVMSGMQTIAPNTLMDKLEKIYIRTRNISRENSSIPTGTDYLPHLLATLSSTAPENARLILKGENSINWSSLSDEKKIILYRVLQEIMINMSKHSKASLVAIIFSEEKNLLNIQYSDNGIGLSNENLKSGNGIQNVENRIFSIKGKLKFEGEQDKGLKIFIQIPV